MLACKSQHTALLYKLLLIILVVIVILLWFKWVYFVSECKWRLWQVLL